MPQVPARLKLTLISTGVILLALLLRIADFPARNEIRNIDETGYCAGSLQLLEGISPGYKAAPAGPLFWTGWTWTGAQTIWSFVHPTVDERHSSLTVRPFLALNRTLFNNYRDLGPLHRVLVIANVIIAIAGAATAVQLGFLYGGSLGGLLIGGLFTVVPVFLQLSEMSRPYSMAWSFGIASFYFACKGNRLKPALSLTGTGIFLGLSIASRIEMLCLLPLVWWIIWDQSTRPGLPRPLVKLTGIALLTATWVSPWLITHLIGNLRTIATVRIGGPPGGAANWLAVLKILLIDNGMGIAMLLAIAGLFFQPAENRIGKFVLAIYALLLLVGMLGEMAYGAHQHGEVFLAWFLLLAVVIRPMVSRFPILITTAAIFAVLFPLVMSIRSIRIDHSNRTNEDAVGWIQQHVAAGATVYVIDGGMRTLLPTPASADLLWNQVTDQQAWQKKMQSGLERFNLKLDQMPRALSEENLIQERGNRRKWFILGSQTDLPDPRYDIHVVLGSPVFGVRDLDAALREKPGIVLWRDGTDLKIPKDLLELKNWVSASGDSVRIYCSPECQTRVRSEGGSVTAFGH